MRVLREEGHGLGRLLECAGMARSSYYYALSHPKAPTRPELWEAAAEIFSRTANGCGHRQIAMCLRAERGVRIADKTALKMMHEMGISCGMFLIAFIFRKSRDKSFGFHDDCFAS